MTAGDWREKVFSFAFNVAGATTERTEVAEPTRRRVSWNVATSKGQWVWKSVVSMIAFSCPVRLDFRRWVICSTSARMARRRSGSERM